MPRTLQNDESFHRSIKSLRLLGLEGQLFQDVWLDESTTFGKDWRKRTLNHTSVES